MEQPGKGKTMEEIMEDKAKMSFPEVTEQQEEQEVVALKKGRGRPKGSKGKKFLTRENKE